MKADDIQDKLLRHKAFELVVEQELTIGEAARRLGIGSRRVYSMLRETDSEEKLHFDITEMLRLKKQLLRVTAERDLLQRILFDVIGEDELIGRTHNLTQ